MADTVSRIQRMIAELNSTFNLTIDEEDTAIILHALNREQARCNRLASATEIRRKAALKGHALRRERQLTPPSTRPVVVPRMEGEALEAYVDRVLAMQSGRVVRG